MKAKIIFFGLITFVFLSASGQTKSRADRFYENGDYINAAKYYEYNLERKGTKQDLERIIESYYNTFQFKNAAVYLKQLINGRFEEKDKSFDNRMHFKYYQILMALGDYETALDFFKLYKKGIGDELDKTSAIATIEAFKLKDPDFEIETVQFNSDGSDFGAIKMGDSVVFVSDRNTKAIIDKKYKWTHRPFLDVYSVLVDVKNDTVGNIKPFFKSVNSKLHEGNICFSGDGQTLYISRSNFEADKKKFNEDRVNTVQLYGAYKIEGKWSKLEKLPFCEDDYSYEHPALSPDGKRLYFSSNKTGGIGDFDIYYVEIKGENYGDPINLGEHINTTNREHFPFISKEGNLFFASNGHLGLGMLDVFVSEFIDGNFTQPVNLGAPINSQYDDFNFNYYDEKQGFFASNRKRLNDDIYQFSQVGEIFLRDYINIFEIRDFETEAYIPDAEVALMSSHGDTIYRNKLDSLAVFNKSLHPGNYRLIAQNSLYFPGDMSVRAIEKQDQKHVLYLKRVPPPPPIDPVEAVIAEKKIDKKLKEDDPKRFEMLTDIEGPPIVEKDGKLFFELEPIYFDFDMWNIRSDSRKILDELAVKLERYPNIHLKISSHTDSRGTVRYNQILSERRAESTRNYLALEGYVNARRLKFEGFGELQPIVPCPMLECTEEEHQLNRRSEFEIIKY